MGKIKEKKETGVSFFVMFLILTSIFLVPLYIVYRMFVKMSDNVDEPLVHTATEDSSGDADSKDDEEESMVALKNKVVKKAKPSTSVKKTIETVSAELTSRQQDMLDFIANNSEVDTSILHAKFKNVTVRTLRRDLKALTDLGLIEKDGETKGATYKKV